MNFQTLLIALLPALLQAQFTAPQPRLAELQKAQTGARANGGPAKVCPLPPSGPAQSGLLPDVGFYQFNFGATDEEVPVKFVFTNKVVQVLTLTDCFLSGDHFKLYDFKKEIGTKSAGCDSNITTLFRADPYGAWKSPGIFCTRTAILLPGTHSITIVPNYSPQAGGSAFLRLDTGCSNGGNIIPCCDLPDAERVCNISIFHDFQY